MQVPTWTEDLGSMAAKLKTLDLDKAPIGYADIWLRKSMAINTRSPRPATVEKTMMKSIIYYLSLPLLNSVPSPTRNLGR